MTSPAERSADKVRILVGLGRNQEAVRAAHAGLRSDPNNAELLGLLAHARQVDGFAHDARMWAERSLAIDPHQAGVIDTRTRSILDGAGTPDEAVESACAAVKLDHTSALYRFNLVRAYLEAERWEDARSTAQSIRAVDPTSRLGPFAQAIVELGRTRYLAFSKRRLFWLGVKSVVSGGIVLLFWATVWLVIYFQGRGPRRRAATHLMEGLRLDPGAANLHTMMAEVARDRFRYVQSVDFTVAAAAIDSGTVDANELARGIVCRTSVMTVVTFVFWCIILLPATAAISAPAVAAAFGSVLAIAAAVGVAWFYWRQTIRLPPGARRLVRRRWGLPATVFVIGAGVSAYGLAVPNQPGIAIPAFAGAALLLIVAGVLTARLVSVWRR